jgi:hypothetical protein
MYFKGQLVQQVHNMPFACQEEKVRLQQALQQVNVGSSASEARLAEMQETIESLRYNAKGYN